MQPRENTPPKKNNGQGFIVYAGQRLLLTVILMGTLVGGGSYILDRLEIVPTDTHVALEEIPSEQAPDLAASQGQPEQVPDLVASQDQHPGAEQNPINQDAAESLAERPQTSPLDSEGSQSEPAAKESPEVDTSVTPPATPVTPHPPQPVEVPPPAQTVPQPAPPVMPDASATKPAAPLKTIAKPPKPEMHLEKGHQPVTLPPRHQQEQAPAAPQPHPQTPKASNAYKPIGATFIEALIQPIDYELNHRFWGWRPNDLIGIADNNKNYQLGVLEVTRRSAVQLAERISRTGSTDAFNTHLQNAMSWFMVKADRYWFPAPESKYKESIKELSDYKQELIKGTASFYTRTDNLIPLLMAYEDLLGSCDENLVKHTEMDGSKVSTFMADNYFYYAKGVASTLAVILEAIGHDFAQTLDSRNGSELLHHAIASCQIAAGLDPWFIFNSDLDGLFANHRANMAAPISHARFYIGQLIKTLST